MRTIQDLFWVRSARSKAFADHHDGDVAFVSNSREGNGVVGYVTPLDGERVFNKVALVVSTFCEATLQLPPFIARGNGGSGLIVLEPRVDMPIRYLAYFAAFVNLQMKWRFNWYRQATVDRLRRLSIPDAVPGEFAYSVEAILPEDCEPILKKMEELQLKSYGLSELFELHPGPYHELNRLTPGDVPVVSCGDGDNGIAGFYAVPAIHAGALTIALNGNTLTAKYHPYSFSAKDDVAICTPRQPMRLTTLLFVQLMLNRERWRYSYYRKCYVEKLGRYIVKLPTVSGELDEEVMADVFEQVHYWEFVRELMSSDAVEFQGRRA